MPQRQLELTPDHADGACNAGRICKILLPVQQDGRPLSWERDYPRGATANLRRDAISGCRCGEAELHDSSISSPEDGLSDTIVYRNFERQFLNTVIGHPCS